MSKQLPAYPNQILYKVRKIFDRRENRPTKRGSYEEFRMCGQAAIPYIPSKKYLQMQKASKKDFQKWANEATFGDVWERQEKLEPIIGQPVYFSSVKMDAGWYRTSAIEKVEYDAEKKVIHLTTAGSVLELREDD
jgi:hypothetical protein